MAVVPAAEILPDGPATSAVAAAFPGSTTAFRPTAGFVSSFLQPSGASPTAADEVAFISGVNADGTLALQSFASWNDDTNPADYGGGYTNAMKWGGNTAGTPGGTVTYYFDPASNWTAAEQSWLAAGLSLWSAIANITFAVTTNPTDAGITFVRGTDGHANTKPSGSGGSDAGITGGTVLWTETGAKISIDTSGNGFGPIDGNFLSFGGYPMMTFLHEEGHAIGLGHAGPYNGKVVSATQQFSAYDTTLSSIMSYIDPRDKTAAYYANYPVKNTNWGQLGGYASVPTTWMPLDILAAQRLYGLPTTTPLSGGQIFGFHCNITGAIEPFFDFSKNTKPVITLWDSGTGNTLDLSNFYSADSVSLVAGTYSSVGDMTNNIAIALGTAIDTLVCGNGSTTVTCNNDGDTIYGGNGSDTIFGGSGNDVLAGGGGTNVLDGGGGTNTVSYAQVTSNVTVDLSLTTAQSTSAYSSDRLTNIQNVIGSSGNDSFKGNAADNVFDGRAGNDTVSYDHFYADPTSGVTVSLAVTGPQAVGGGQGTDTLINIENLVGTGADDTLTGDAGNNVLDGGGGHNTLSGGAGDDTLIDSGTASTLDGGTGTNTITLDRGAALSDVVATLALGTGTSFTFPDGTTFRNFTNLNLITGFGNDTLTFTSFSNEAVTWDGRGGTNKVIADFSSYSGSLVWSGMSAFEGDTQVLKCTNMSSAEITCGSGNDHVSLGYSGTTIDGGSGDDKLDYSYTPSGALSLVFQPGSSAWVSLSNGSSFRNFEHLRLITSPVAGASVTFLNPIYDAVWGGNFWNNSGNSNATATIVLDSDGSGLNTTLSNFGSVAEYTVQQLQGGVWVNTVVLDSVSNVVITGGSGSDSFVSGAGNDVFNGGLGQDKVVYGGARAAYTITRTGLTTTILGPDGTDTLTGIDKLTFSDRTLWLSPPQADANGDGTSDILWQSDNGQAAIWTMNGFAQLGGSPVGGNPGSSWHIKASGDFNGDGYADILWQNDNGQADIWTMNGFTQLGGSLVGGNPGANWHIKGSGDFNGDGAADILWQSDSGQAAIWTMNGFAQLGGAEVGINPGADWHVKGTGDFNGDGKADILWQNDNGQAAIWLMDGFGVASGSTIGGNPGAAWHVVGAGDFNGDGKSDILWQNDSGQAAIWTMDGLTQTGGSPVGSNPGPTWHAIGAGDFNGDGYADILWQNDNAQAAVWTMQGLNQLGGSTVGGNPGTSWHVVT